MENNQETIEKTLKANLEKTMCCELPHSFFPLLTIGAEVPIINDTETKIHLFNEIDEYDLGLEEPLTVNGNVYTVYFWETLNLQPKGDEFPEYYDADEVAESAGYKNAEELLSDWGSEDVLKRVRALEAVGGYYGYGDFYDIFGPNYGQVAICFETGDVFEYKPITES
jgi:hypothetical protein